MTLEATPPQEPGRPAAGERKLLAEMAAPVRRAAKLVTKQRSPELSMTDLEAIGILAVWRRLAKYDPERATFDDWAFYQAIHAMLDAVRDEQQHAAFIADVSTGVRGVPAQDDRPPELDLQNDTPETDGHRIKTRTRVLAASGWTEAAIERARGAASLERRLEATEEVLFLRRQVGRFPEPLRSYVQLRFWDDQEVQELARRLGVPERTMRRRWVEAREKLTEVLRREGIHGIPEDFGTAADALAMAERTDGEEPER